MRKGQSFSFDAIIAAIIFVVAIFSFFSFLLFSQSTNDYRKDIMDKEMIRISSLMMSEDSYYGIMDSVTANRIIAADTEMDTRISHVDGTSPYRLCIKIASPAEGATPVYHPFGCNADMVGSTSETRTARIVQDQSGGIVSMVINLYDKPG
jgi:hypothetical protein